MTNEVSLLKPLGYQRKNSCGYCKSTSGSSAYYMSCDNMRLDHYQELMDRGWRRSGSLYYKPDLVHSCCPHYTIRLKAADYKPLREQRRAINRWNDFVIGPEYKRKVAMLCPQSREEKRRNRDKFDLLTAVHKAEYDKLQRPLDKKTGRRIEPAHKFEVNLEGDSFSKEKYDVFLKYQLQIHKDPPSRWKEQAFKRFLCTGLDRKILKINGKTLKLGSYHQCYRVDGKLVAVGVLDLLPHAVSSVYLFYDPEYHHWDFGKISALREIALALEAHYEYYYMGYYIHSCTKMRYKARFGPCYLLDPETYKWNLFDDNYRRELDKRKYVSPSHDRKYGVPREANASLPETSTTISRTESDGSKPPATTKERSRIFDDEQDLEFDEPQSDEDDAEIPEGSLFDFQIPGVLSLDEVKRLDLDHWRLLVRNALIELEDLRGWEDWKIDDPGSIKGIAAELIATTGPKLLQNSALALF
ncbi:Arginyl-tRNA--protein transferase 1 [Exophiala dermatitidis]|uniref:arginyltransferase n=2 Tax=Exophiala dermatitidis TaxID=5970 RepID=H6C8A2_EXODN|nr:arginine-tRNA-protein transferase [Exophiala dermatitidis NIH/UT8656]KAJ4523441.1 Arginyl-tRNA--protein transferase 1 [Exophiala dermatitidis]EHY60329.1 arginine-tRNA-protein transferase [Exophiala dermatitidis NIH/UT8656]KAJ4524490.1 Arginyl-tRNA--protein transferase 1 [Exophiala dermatitidis]KAJ4527337.1 Arginyl-tRNA--protein transferase 1 [Exophiala dermatitidis]KAJ4530893.1 Arginyl-tRNA--protein transferase 1 [Exophiala dermatitidis]